MIDELKKPEAAEEDFECPKHGMYRGRKVVLSLFREQRTFTLPPACPQCEREAEAEREKHAEADGERQLAAMNIGRYYWNKGFENFEARTSELALHLETARRYARRPHGKLVMLGGNGTGKTHLAVSILRETGGVIYTAYEVGVRLRQGYGGGGEGDVLKELCEKPLLVIDEVGRTKGSDFELNWLSHVINKRHENLLPLLLISNRHLMENCAEGEKGCPKCLENFFDNDVISRIIEDGLVMKFTGDDYRMKIRRGEEYESIG